MPYADKSISFQKSWDGSRHHRLWGSGKQSYDGTLPDDPAFVWELELPCCLVSFLEGILGGMDGADGRNMGGCENQNMEALQSNRRRRID